MTAPHDDDDLPTSTAGEHPLSPALDALALACEQLQTFAEELGEGRRLAQEVEEAWQDVRDRAVWEG